METKIVRVEFPFYIVLLLWSSAICCCSPRENGKSIALKAASSGAVNPAAVNVMNFGAKGDGKTDDAKAFLAAWAEACKTAGSKLMVPSGSVFLVGPVSFLGTGCASNVVVQLDGTISCANSNAWGSSSLMQWLEFSKVQGLTIQGKGTIEGQGRGWWTDLPTNNLMIGRETSAKNSGTRPTALRFYGCSNVSVTGITIRNSPKMHLKFDNCKAVRVVGVVILSPENSPNTDGIHLQNSQDVSISDCTIECGDDCVSIQTGSSNVDIRKVRCGSGHGISIGGLGQDKTKACVSGVTIQDVNLQGTKTGVRIKSWQGGTGSANKIKFSNIQVSRVEIPIVIDQYYCDQKGPCPNSTSAVAISDITYDNIKGTYTSAPMSLACSNSVPCTAISLTSIDLTPAQTKGVRPAFCEAAYGKVATTTAASVSCLKANRESSTTVQSNVDSC